MWYWVPRSNIQQISYIPQTEQYSPFARAHAASSGECNYYLLLLPVLRSVIVNKLSTACDLITK